MVIMLLNDTFSMGRIETNGGYRRTVMHRRFKKTAWSKISGLLVLFVSVDRNSVLES